MVAVKKGLNKDESSYWLQAAGAAGAIAIACSFTTADAGESHAFMTVGATVVAVARIERLSAPKDILVSAADLRRGYMDLDEPVAVTVRSNSTSGYALDVDPVSAPFAWLIISGSGVDQRFGPAGSSIVQRWHNLRTDDLSLRFRFVLAPGALAGRYAWPTHLRVRPLDVP